MNPLQRLRALQAENDSHAAFMAMHSERFDKLRARHEDGTAPRAVSAYQLFQTPAPLAQKMADLAQIDSGCHVLEPSSGLGRLLDPILARNPRKVTACEFSAELAGELFRTYPGVELLQGDFLARDPFPVDRVVMNPPFHMRSDIRHTLHALKFLRPGGRLVGLAMAGKHREAQLRPLATHWESIPAGTFRKEGTNVETILFTVEF